MTHRNDLLSLSFYKKSPYTGSNGSIRFRIAQKTTDDLEQFEVILWRGPYNFEVSDPAQMLHHLEPFTEKGLDNICNFINEAVDKELL